MINYFAFLGTGPCDPNKSTKEAIALMGVIAGWIVITVLVSKVNRSNKSNAIKIGISVPLIATGVIGTGFIFLATWLGLACSGGR